MRKRFLLGATKDKELVFGEYELRYPSYWSKEKRNWTDKNILEFSASFDTVRPFRTSEVDLEEYYEDWLDGFDKEYLYNECCRHNCAPRDLAYCMARECKDVRDAIDCSLYPKLFTVDEIEFAFESRCCGQHDTFGEMEFFTSEEGYQNLYSLWKTYHLKNINVCCETEKVLKAIDDLAEQFGEINENNWIKKYIFNHILYED